MRAAEVPAAATQATTGPATQPSATPATATATTSPTTTVAPPTTTGPVAAEPSPAVPDEPPFVEELPAEVPVASPHPVPPATTVAWPARVLWAIGGLFGAAAVLGPVVARRRPADPPEFDDDGAGH